MKTKNSTFYISHSTSIRGFTLIELLVAATIIGILTAIAVLNYTSAQRKARDAKRKTDLENIRGALEMRRVDCGSYKTTDLPWGSSWSETCNGDTYTYMQLVPQDPKNSSAGYKYYYHASADGITYELCAYLESGGTDTCSGSCGTVACNYKVTQP